MKKTIERCTGIPVSIGIAETKVLAKAANHYAKKVTKNGVCVLKAPHQVNNVLLNTPIQSVWGIGRKNSAKMIHLGIKSAYDLKNFHDEKYIKKKFTIVGSNIQKELQGKIKFELELEPEKKKENHE